MKKQSQLTVGAFGLLLAAGMTSSAFAGSKFIDPSAIDYIVGGTTVSASDPVASTTVIVSDGNYICTGSIIAEDIVVTAAHCVDADPRDLKVIFSRTLPQSFTGSAVHDIYGFVANPGWQGDSSSGPDEHDIAIIRFKGHLPSGYAAANLLDENANLRPGQRVTLAGYGITDAETHDGAGTLRKVNVTVKQKLGQTEVILDQTSGKGACHGDSGGPAFVTSGGKLLLWGVTNRGYPDNAPDDCVHYAVYTRITAYSDFIAQAEDQLRNPSFR
jgi:secreted trypsin-like serine protease